MSGNSEAPMYPMRIKRGKQENLILSHDQQTPCGSFSPFSPGAFSNWMAAFHNFEGHSVNRGNDQRNVSYFPQRCSNLPFLWCKWAK